MEGRTSPAAAQQEIERANVPLDKQLYPMPYCTVLKLDGKKRHRVTLQQGEPQGGVISLLQHSLPLPKI